MIPGENHYTYHHRVEINRHGLRGAEIQEEKEPGEIRVLALGDSMTYGQGVAEDQTLPAHLERLLNEREAGERKWRVINCGHRAYSTNQEVALLAELGPQLEPDLVIPFWFWNDLFDVDIPTKHAELLESGPVAIDTGAPMRGFTLWKWKVGQLARRSALVMYVHDLLRDATEAEPKQQLIDKRFRVFDGHLARMVELAGEHGWRLVFASIPNPSALVRDHFSLQLAERARALARDHGLERIDLLPRLKAFSASSGSRPIIPYDGHYLGEGNEVMAEAVAEALLGK